MPDEPASQRPNERLVLDETLSGRGDPSSRAADTDDLTSVGRYTILERLGSGAMGVVYAAYDPELDRKIALKLIRAGHSDAGRVQMRMLREAQALARLSHPNVVHVYEVGQFRGQVFLAMEFCAGSTLTEWLEQEPRSWRDVLRILLQAGAGLSAAHDAGLVHRDFKPDNVLVGTDGRVRVLDFGLALGAGREDDEDPGASGKDVTKLDTRVTQAGTLIGTPAFMSPEQITGSEADARSDQFSFCVTLYEALYGEPAFDGDDLDELFLNITETRFAPLPRDRLRRVPGWVHKRMLQGLHRNPDERHASMHGLLSALDHDPRTRRRWLYYGASGVVLSAALGSELFVLAQERSSACQQMEDKLSGVWDPATRIAIESAFGRIHAPFAAEAWDRAEPVLRGYARSWAESEVGLCEARQRGDQPAELLERRTICLDRRLQELGHLTTLLTKADEAVAERAVIAARSLPSIARCGTIDHLMAVDQLPGGRLRQSLEILEGRLSSAEALLRAGQLPLGVQAGNRALQHARRIEHGPSTARALIVLGELHRGAGRLAEAEKLLHEGARAAEEAGADAIRARAIIRLVAVIGDRGRRTEQAEEWARYARAVLRRTGGDPASAAELESNVGEVYFRQQRFDEALAQYQQALAMQAEAVGRDHPAVADVLARIGAVHVGRDDHESAVAVQRDALAIRKSALGIHHADVIASLRLLSESLEALGQAGDAVAPAEQALELRAAATDDVAELAGLRFTLARALWPTERARALELLELARTGFLADPAAASDLAGLDAWVAERPPSPAPADG